MRGGFTLLELLLAVALLGIAAGMAALTLRSAEPRALSGWRDVLIDARTRAITTGIPVTGALDTVGRFTAFPSGLVVSDSAPVIHLGSPTHAP